jgi:hypothetical protein
MQAGSNKEVVSRYFLQGLGELNPDVIDEVFAPTTSSAALSSGRMQHQASRR